MRTEMTYLILSGEKNNQQQLQQITRDINFREHHEEKQVYEVINDINYLINNMALTIQQLQQNIDALEQQ